MNKQLDLNGVRIYKSEKQDIIDAIDLIGQEVYVSDYEDFSTYRKCEFIGIEYLKEEKDKHSFIGGPGIGGSVYKYFILAKDVKFEEEPKKTYRPYNTMNEFPFRIGDIITYKSKEVDIQKKAIVTCFIEHIYSQFPKQDLFSIQFSNKSYNPDELLKYFEYLDSQTNEWKPFGVEE